MVQYLLLIPPKKTIYCQLFGENEQANAKRVKEKRKLHIKDIVFVDIDEVTRHLIENCFRNNRRACMPYANSVIQKCFFLLLLSARE